MKMMDKWTTNAAAMASALMLVLAMGCGEDIAKKGSTGRSPGTMPDVRADVQTEDTGDSLDASSDMGSSPDDASTSEDQGGEADGSMVDMADTAPDMTEDTGPRVCDLNFESTLRPALHIIADYSGSMSVGLNDIQAKYQIQNSSLTTYADRMTSQFRVGFVSFPLGSTCADSVDVHVPMGEWDASAITSNLQSSPTGGSSSAAALRDVAESMRFSSANDPDSASRERHVLIIADSEGNQCLSTGDDIVSAQQMALDTGATLYAIAFDERSNSFPENASLQTGGTYSLVSNASEMDPAFETALDAMDPCTLTLTSAPDPSTFKLFDAGTEVDASDFVLNGLDVTLSDSACSTVSFEDLTATTSC